MRKFYTIFPTLISTAIIAGVIFFLSLNLNAVRAQKPVSTPVKNDAPTSQTLTMDEVENLKANLYITAGQLLEKRAAAEASIKTINEQLKEINEKLSQLKEMSKTKSNDSKTTKTKSND